MKTIDLHGFTLDIPDDHWLPQIRQQLPDYSENVGRLAATVETKYPGRGFIDIGANIGDTAAIVRAHSKLPILCIEGSEFYYELLERNVRQLSPIIELEHALVDSETCERQGRFTIEYGTANFRPVDEDGVKTPFTKLDSILGRHPKFQTAKVLKIDTDGMDGRILSGALEWIRTARPVLFWEHDVGRDMSAQGPGLAILARLVEIGYPAALTFDNTGEFMQQVALDNRQQLADLSDYLPGGDELYGYCDMCAFHEEDADLCSSVRRVELETRSNRRKTSPKALNEPLFRALVQWQFEVFGGAITRTVERAVERTESTYQGLEGLRTKLEAELNDNIVKKTAEMQALRAHYELERYRMRTQIGDLEKQISNKDAEISRMHVIARELIAEMRGEPGSLAAAREEARRLKQELESSLALRMARSLGFILRPIRRLISGNGGDRAHV